jgi:hypothetical protein
MLNTIIIDNKEFIEVMGFIFVDGTWVALVG